MADTELVSIAKVVKPHGLKGELSVIWHADAPFLLDEVPLVLLQAKAPEGRRIRRPKRFRVKSWRPHQERLLVILEGIDGRDQAQAWAGADMLVRARDLPEPDEDELFLWQLEGLKVYLAIQGKENGEEYLGDILEIMTPQPEQEVWVIRTPDDTEVLIPAHEDTVLSVDLKQGTALVDPPPGLLDIYLGKG